MKVTFWGTRGSIAAAGPETERFGGNTACVQVLGADGSCLVLDAGTGIRALGEALPSGVRRIDVLLTHLHMDHIQGLGFFGPLFRPELEVHIWGPPSATLDLRARLSRYLSPPLFPIRLRDMGARLELHNTPEEAMQIGCFEVRADLVVHPGPTVGYRISDGGTIAYLPDHEPALGVGNFPDEATWTSGFDLARDVDLLIHDAQYFAAERAERIGWGHSSSAEVASFASLVGARQLACFHHDPAHDDETVERLVREVAAAAGDGLQVVGAREGMTVEI
jgi:phosphoribosyl 1,2-cyclic phosphodiesterase